jgi:hypothetical protein
VCENIQKEWKKPDRYRWVKRYEKRQREKTETNGLTVRPSPYGQFWGQAGMVGETGYLSHCTPSSKTLPFLVGGRHLDSQVHCAESQFSIGQPSLQLVSRKFPPITKEQAQTTF